MNDTQLQNGIFNEAISVSRFICRQDICGPREEMFPVAVIPSNITAMIKNFVFSKYKIAFFKRVRQHRIERGKN